MKRRLARIIPWALTVLVLLSLSGCADTPPTTLPQTSPPATASEVGLLGPQPVDLEDIVNLDNAALTDAEKQVLAGQSFVAVAPPAGQGAWKFWSIYEEARYQGLPVFITTDSLLNSYHELLDVLVQKMEEGGLYDEVQMMTQELYGAAYDQWAQATNTIVKTDAWANRVFFAVGAALLDPEASRPTELQDLIGAELALITAAEGLAESPNLGYTMDYSQFKPRGHYTSSERLERYFRAMMWYGQAAFYVNEWEPDVTEEEAARLTRRAVLISSSLTGAAGEAWTAVYRPTGFLVGLSDDISPADLQQVVQQVFGTVSPSADQLADATSMANVRRGMNGLAAPRIGSVLSGSMAGGDDDTSAEEDRRSFRVMGQRYTPDSFVMQRLVWPYVSTVENKRYLPMGLDVMTVLGSAEAYRLQTQVYDQGSYEGWEAGVEDLRGLLDEPGSDLWPTNLYTGWLDVLRELVKVPGKTIPPLFRSQPWALKSLNAALGSWTESRHDTLLYAKQSVTAEGEGGEEPLSPGYVEPNPVFYNKVADLAEALKQQLSTEGLLDADSEERLDRMVALARALAAISEKELSGTDLSDDEISLIQTYGQELEELEQFHTDANGLRYSPTADRSPVVADVHSDYVTSPPRVLEEATGYPLYLYVALEVDGAVQVFVGASYSYYEFTAPLDGRMTDEEWIATLDSEEPPELPEWTDAWIVRR